MNLLEAIRNITKNNIIQINQCIQSRLYWLEMREPESDGTVYEQWEEKYDEWTEIAEKSEEIIGNLENNDYELQEAFDELTEMIEDFQLMHKGLSRLKI